MYRLFDAARTVHSPTRCVGRYGGSCATQESFNDWGGRGFRKLVLVSGGDGTKIAPPVDIFDQLPGEMRRIRGKPTDHVENHAVLHPEGAVSMTTPGT